MAKKKYHQSVKDRMSESRGMERYETKKEMSAMEHYAGYDARRRREIEDGRMLNEDHSAIANLPQNVMYHDWPSSSYGPSYNLNDGIEGIDRQMRDDSKEMKRELFPEKY